MLRTQTNVKNAIIFANRKTTVALLEKSLKTHGFNAGALHGDMDQSARTKMLAAFRANEITYLIASDVAARGLDIPEVSHIFNFDVPIHAEDYVHRIGRTGRAGREGQAFTMACREEAKYVKAIEALIKKDIEWFDIGTVELSEDDGHAERPKRGHRERSEKPKRERQHREPRVEVSAEAAAETVADLPQHEPRAPRPRQDNRPPRQEKPSRDRGGDRDRKPAKMLDDAPDHGRFSGDNIPAFLVRR